MNDPSASVKPVTNQEFKQDSAGMGDTSLTGARLLILLLVTCDLTKGVFVKYLGPFPISKIGTTNPLPSLFNLVETSPVAYTALDLMNKETLL